MKILIELSETSFEVRQKLAESTSDANVLKALAQDKDTRIRLRVAENKNTTPEVLLKLANDEDYYVRKAVTESVNVTPEILENLLGDARL